MNNKNQRKTVSESNDYLLNPKTAIPPYTQKEKLAKWWQGLEYVWRENTLMDVCGVDINDRITMEHYADMSWEQLPATFKAKISSNKFTIENLNEMYTDQSLEDMIAFWKHCYGTEHDKKMYDASINSAEVPVTAEWITYPIEDRKRFLEEIGIKNPKDVSADFLWNNLTVEQMKDLAVKVFG